MKTKTTIQPEENKVLLKVDTHTLESQRTFLRVLAGKLTLVAHEWDALNVNPGFDIQDIDRLERYSVDEWIKGKILPTLNNAAIGGIKASPEKVFEMMELPDLSLFKMAYANVVDYLKETRQSQILRMEKSVEYNSAFFFMDNGEVKVNEKRLGLWYEKNCTTYAATRNQERVFDLLKQLANTMNELKRTDDAPANSLSRVTIDFLKNHPGPFMRNEMSQLLKVDAQGNYEPNIDWILKH